MTRLCYEQVLKDDDTKEPNSISNLALTSKALSDVSCLSKFKSLTRLDLRLNSLTSLEGLRSCVNLKWLCVLQNKLETLEGVQGLAKLTVLNAAKNKLKSMDQLKSLTSLQALVLNENEISSIGELDQSKDLNTLVLSKNPIRKIGDSLVKLKSMTKLSLSYCQIQTIGSSFKSCVKLRELRLSHNDISSFPDELVNNPNLSILDLGHNAITRWSDLKVIKSLGNLRNLNLQGNPIATNDKVESKIRKALLKLRIFNARPVNKYTKNEKGVGDNRDDDLVADTSKLQGVKENEEHILIDQKRSAYTEPASDLDKTSRMKRKKTVETIAEDGDRNVINSDMDKRKKKRKDNKLSEKPSVFEENKIKVERKLTKKPKKVKRREADVIDDAEASFAEIFEAGNEENLKYNGDEKSHQISVSNKVEFPAKTRKCEKLDIFSPSVEIGNGGPSTWGDD